MEIHILIHIPIHILRLLKIRTWLYSVQIYNHTLRYLQDEDGFPFKSRFLPYIISGGFSSLPSPVYSLEININLFSTFLFRIFIFLESWNTNKTWTPPNLANPLPGKQAQKFRIGKKIFRGKIWACPLPVAWLMLYWRLSSWVQVEYRSISPAGESVDCCFSATLRPTDECGENYTTYTYSNTHQQSKPILQEL